MYHDTPPHAPDHRRSSHAEPALPTLQLPPAPFGRRPDSPPAAPQFQEQLPAGTSVRDLLGALAETSSGHALAARPTSAPTAPPAPPAPSHLGAAVPSRPLESFSAAVERRGRRERRREARTTPDRRLFRSGHLASPLDGPADPRPTGPPPIGNVAVRPAPIDPVMPPLPLEPALSVELTTRGVAADTQRTTRAGTASAAPSTMPFPGSAATAPPPAPEQPQLDAAAIEGIAPNPTTGHAALAGIFDARSDIPVGHLQPRDVDAPSSAIPLAGPAGPSSAPGAGLDAVAAAVATAPSAWYGGAVQVDDAMMVWNAPGAQAPLAPSVAAMIAPHGTTQPGSGPAPAPTPPAPLATTPLAPGAAPDAPAAGAPRGRLATLLRLLLVVGIPAASGIAIAIAIDRFAF